ncbi:hypothetical protein [Streptomyces sp. NPDC058373]|uniref:hypothetical protein n=1 Tax=Streptomyces sp. NPDC058373 TaxID=3346465 RepID=UPI0036525DC9
MPATADGGLPLPTTLSKAELRGAECVWCGTPVTAEAVVDLGVRPDPSCPWASWYPRACLPCAEARS